MLKLQHDATMVAGGVWCEINVSRAVVERIDQVHACKDVVEPVLSRGAAHLATRGMVVAPSVDCIKLREPLNELELAGGVDKRRAAVHEAVDSYIEVAGYEVQRS